MKLKLLKKIEFPKPKVFVSILIILLPFLVFVPITTVKAQFPMSITVQTAYTMINNNTQYPNLLILDVREQNEYDESHLYNATLIPRLEIDARIDELIPYNGTEIIVYCRAGSRSLNASTNLADNHGFTEIYNMLGGIDAWIAAGYPVWTNTIAQPSISFHFTPFILILFGSFAVLILYYKKSGYK